MIPMVGSPAKRPFYGDLVTGESSRFNANNGSWTNSGGTLTWDSTSTYRWGLSGGSLKLACTSNGQYAELAISGTFKSGVEYICWVAVTLEGNTTFNPAIDVHFGLIGTDAVIITDRAIYADQAGTAGRYTSFGLRWVPSADRTGVKVRVTNKGGTMTFHLGQCRAFRAPEDRRTMPLEMVEASGAWTTGHWLHVEPSLGSTRIGVGEDGGIAFTAYGVLLENEWTSAPFSGLWLAEDGSGWQSETNITPGDLADAGMYFEVGADYVGYYVNEKDSDTLQLYADTSGGYMMQLRHRGSGKGWAVSPDGTDNVRMEAYFDWVFTKSGTLSVATNVALPYYRTPFKCKITEVQAHVGTAPTGTNILVDVNDDGTTIFTTQGNRPEIAVSTNDDTSGTPDGGTSVAAGSVITVDVDQIGSGTAGADLTVQVRGYFIW